MKIGDWLASEKARARFSSQLTERIIDVKY